MTTANPVIKLDDLVKHFRQGRFTGRKVVHALNGVSFSVHGGETLGVVGETGCGKTTLGRVAMRLYRPTAGKVIFDGIDISGLPERKLKFLRRNMQVIFQDPADSMNSRLTVGYIIEEPLVIQTRLNTAERREIAHGLLEEVGLSSDAYYRYPHEFSGGQRQRIAIARALSLSPKAIVCDEPVSALDVSVQSQVLNLLLDLQETKHLTMIFISHDLSVVRHMSDRIVVMYLGSVMELAESKTIYENPQHPYTQALIAAIPQIDPNQKKEPVSLAGEPPSPIDLPPGCPFQQNCPRSVERCATEKPELREIAPGHQCACHLV
jgi:oligopeptide/dipeptide ABC transporter ATP-binding protein